MVLQKLTNIYSGDWDGQARGRGEKQLSNFSLLFLSSL